MGLFFYTQKGSIISTVVLPTTEIIEPKKNVDLSAFFLSSDEVTELDTGGETSWPAGAVHE